MASEANDQRLREIIQSWPQTPGQALEQLKPLAAEGNIRAIVLLAVMLLQGDQFDEAIVYARQAVQAGIGAVAQIFANAFAARSREDLRSKAPEFIGAALETGWNIDIRNLLVNAVSEGKAEVAWELLDLALEPVPLNARKRWEELVAKATSDGEQITTAAAVVSTQREQAVATIAEQEEAVKARRSSAEGAADELGLVLSDVAAQSLANAYAKEAKRTENQARWYTWLALVIGALSVAAAVYGLVTLKVGSSWDKAVARAAYGLPSALFIPFVSSLASVHRKEAWRLRHIELQIRTANPFLTLLDDDRRKETLATLALRFFPGQEHVDSDTTDVQSMPLEIIEGIGKLLREQKPAVVSAPTPPTAE